MFPTLIDLGTVRLPWLGQLHLALPTYGALFALAVLGAGAWFIRRARGLGLPEETLYNLVFYSLVAGILGAKAGLVLLDWRTYLEDPAALLGTLRAAGVLLFGVVCGVSVFLLYARRHGLPALTLADAVAAPLAAAQAVGRLGCFSAGCCWGVGVHADHPLAVIFTDPVAHRQTGVPLGQPLLAVQLVQMANDLALALFLTWLWRRRPRPAGMVFWTYVLLYGITRGTIELWRGDTQRGLAAGISTSQFLSAAGVALALVMLSRGFGRSARHAPR